MHFPKLPNQVIEQSAMHLSVHPEKPLDLRFITWDFSHNFYFEVQKWVS
jgi:hypothetical protein